MHYLSSGIPCIIKFFQVRYSFHFVRTVRNKFGLYFGNVIIPYRAGNSFIYKHIYYSAIKPPNLIPIMRKYIRIL